MCCQTSVCLSVHILTKEEMFSIGLLCAAHHCDRREGFWCHHAGGGVWASGLCGTIWQWTGGMLVCLEIILVFSSAFELAQAVLICSHEAAVNLSVCPSVCWHKSRQLELESTSMVLWGLALIPYHSMSQWPILWIFCRHLGGLALIQNQIRSQWPTWIL